MTADFESWIAGLRQIIQEVDADEAYSMTASGSGVLIDIREADEVASGSPKGAVQVARGFLEIKISSLVRTQDQSIYVICAGGNRSLIAANSLQSMGYRNVKSVKGGYNNWLRLGLPTEIPAQLSAEERSRYSRHLKIPEIGESGQLKLGAAKVLLVGAGGLGSPAAYYLAAAGIGTLGLIDDDVVDRSNLQRQILHTDARVGKKKVESAKETLLSLNPGIRCLTFDARISETNIEEIFSQFDIIVDGTDNFQARYLIADACVKLGLPNVHGAVYQFEGYTTVFSPDQHGGPCYRCWYPEAPPPEFAPSCNEAGVLGVLPGVIGLLQAVETIKLVLGMGSPLVGRVLSYNALDAEFNEYEIERKHDCPVCSKHKEHIQLKETAAVCAI